MGDFPDARVSRNPGKIALTLVSARAREQRWLALSVARGVIIFTRDPRVAHIILD